MVKRKGISRRPKTADDFVNAGSDAELKTSKPKIQETPHRISLDVDDELYRALKIAALDAGVPMVQLIRDTLTSKYVSK